MFKMTSKMKSTSLVNSLEILQILQKCTQEIFELPIYKPKHTHREKIVVKAYPMPTAGE